MKKSKLVSSLIGGRVVDYSFDVNQSWVTFSCSHQDFKDGSVLPTTNIAVASADFATAAAAAIVLLDDRIAYTNRAIATALGILRMSDADKHELASIPRIALHTLEWAKKSILQSLKSQ